MLFMLFCSSKQCVDNVSSVLNLTFPFWTKIIIIFIHHHHHHHQKMPKRKKRSLFDRNQTKFRKNTIKSCLIKDKSRALKLQNKNVFRFETSKGHNAKKLEYGIQSVVEAMNYEFQRWFNQQSLLYDADKSRIGVSPPKMVSLK